VAVGGPSPRRISAVGNPAPKLGAVILRGLGLQQPQFWFGGRATNSHSSTLGRASNSCISLTYTRHYAGLKRIRLTKVEEELE